MIDFDYSITARGALFDGRASMLMRRYARRVEEATADFAWHMVQRHLGGSLKHPTGYYQSQVQVRSIGGHPAVTDGNVIYGPWLEGVGSRNFPVTRFRGYHSFRKAQADTELRAAAIADRVWNHEIAAAF